MVINDKMTIQDIAGFCPEGAIWKMLADVSTFLLNEESGYQLNTDTIMVEGNQFMVMGAKDCCTKADMVWELGGIAYYAATGHVVFGGHGKCYQQNHPKVTLPVMPKSLQALTPVVSACLQYDTANRISMEELCKLSKKGHAECLQRQRTKVAYAGKTANMHQRQGEKWPEEMKE